MQSQRYRARHFPRAQGIASEGWSVGREGLALLIVSVCPDWEGSRVPGSGGMHTRVLIQPSCCFLQSPCNPFYLFLLWQMNWRP